VNEQPTQANPEYLYHYEQLRRSRSGQRWRGALLLIVASVLLAGMIWLGINAPLKPQGVFLTLLLFVGLFIVLVWRGWRALRQGFSPIGDAEVARRRQEDRQQLFQFAQGRRPWQYWLKVVGLGLPSLCLLAMSGYAVWMSLLRPDDDSLLGVLFSLPFLLVGSYYLYQAIRNARLLIRLQRLGSQELAARLSLGESTQGE
jgi:threonine/homoserine/homoserine lactone efflux protein